MSNRSPRRIKWLTWGEEEFGQILDDMTAEKCSELMRDVFRLEKAHQVIIKHKQDIRGWKSASRSIN